VTRSPGSAPSSCSSGTSVYSGSATSTTVSGLTDGTTYGFRVCAVDNAGNTSTASVTYAVGGKEECKAGGHSQFLVPSFKNQGLCVSTYSGKK